jgi:hypothetical protein
MPWFERGRAARGNAVDANSFDAAEHGYIYLGMPAAWGNVHISEWQVLPSHLTGRKDTHTRRLSKPYVKYILIDKVQSNTRAPSHTLERKAKVSASDLKSTTWSHLPPHVPLKIYAAPRQTLQLQVSLSPYTASIYKSQRPAQRWGSPHRYLASVVSFAPASLVRCSQDSLLHTPPLPTTA